MTQGPVELVVFDRDGVVNVERDRPIADPADLELVPGAAEGLRRLAAAGAQLAIATNQSAIGRGLVTVDEVTAVNDALTETLAHVGVELLAIEVCPHVDDDRCRCRKPAPGLIDALIGRAGTTPARTWVVGDMGRDLAAGRAAGASVALVRTGKGRATEAALRARLGLDVFDDLIAFADHLVGRPTRMVR